MQTKRSYLGGVFWYLASQFWLGAGAIQGNCATNEIGVDKYPDSLISASAAFKFASTTNRYSEAETVLKVLPKCPITFEKDTGTGVVRGYDFSKPSYTLPSKHVLGFLGEPSLITTNSGALHYYYIIRQSGTGEPWSLCIEFRNDRVVLAKLSGPVSRVY